MPERLADFENQAVVETARRIAGDALEPRARIERLFLFIRDQIPLGFTRRWNHLKASEVLAAGVGHCNTKATLFHACCKVLGIPSRIHYGLIRRQIMRGFAPRVALLAMPSHVSHGWLEVELEGRWRRLDAYINDRSLFVGCQASFEERGLEVGYSLSRYQGRYGCELSLDDELFVHMGAVDEDHGTWDDPAEYYASDRYVVLNWVQLTGYRMLVGQMNRAIARARRRGEALIAARQGPPAGE